MKYLSWLFIGIALALCLSLATPPAAQAASKSTQANVRKDAKKARQSAKNNDHKALAPRKKAKSAAQAKKVREQDARSTKGAQKGKDSREIWLERAQTADLFTGKASWYGSDFHNKLTASGHSYDMYTFTAAHRTLPMGTVVRVTDQDNGKSVMVCVTDRGPYVRGRIIDLSYAAARQLDLGKRGVGRVRLEVISDTSGTPLKADDAYYVRYKAGQSREKLGPFRVFADAAAMHEALSQAHPEAEMVLGSAR